MKTMHQHLIDRLAALFRQLPEVEAIALAGSLTSGAAPDPASDIDLYVFTTAAPSLSARTAIVQQTGGAARANMNLDYWGLGDEWIDAETGIEVDVVYWDTGWIEGMLDRVLRLHRASLGYTTAFWHTLRTAQILFDCSGWLGKLKEQCEQPYPEALRKNIIAYNLPVLRDAIPSYAYQIKKAVCRGDLVSANHRVAALLASYFDVIFAFNRVLHPGEKRQLEQAARLCPRLPDDMRDQVTAVLRAAGQGDELLIEETNRLIDGLERLLEEEGLPSAGALSYGQ